MATETVDTMHIQCAKALAKPCAVEGCETEPIRVRFTTNPPWGWQPDTNNTKLSGEREFLLGVHDEIRGEDYDTGVNLDQLSVYCLPHFPRQDPPKPDATAKPRTVWQETRILKEAAIQAYGGKCAHCGQTSPSQLVLCLTPENDGGQGVWEANGATSWTHKWQVLKDLAYPAGLCVVRCFACRADYTQTIRKPSVINLRLRVITAYGGQCVGCGDTNQLKLWLVRKSGAQILRWPNGRKLTSKQKFERMWAEGCPDTHMLMCPDCWGASRVGGGSGYEGS